MENPHVLLIHSVGSPLIPVQKLLEDQGFRIHLTRSWEEAERVLTLFPSGEVKYVFIDVTLCQGNPWEKFIHRARMTASDLIVICFHPFFAQSLYSLLKQSPAVQGAAQLSVNLQSPLVVGDTPKFREILSLANRYAQHDVTVLLTGETGTGKEVLARYIHLHSSRKDKPFVACNMTAIPETLVESELFGYVKGAFTGADKNKKGLIEAAEGGTLFLDEIGDLPLTIQLKLLRFLESREFYKIGESTAKTANVRVVAATNKELESAISNNEFRKDLYYRLNSARIIIPPLRERKEDILLLATTLVDQASSLNQRPPKKISSSVKALFLDYPWPGNVRELKNVLESAAMVSDDEFLTLGDCPMHLQQYAAGHREEIGVKAISNLDHAEKSVIEETLKQTNGNKVQAARALGISVRTLYRKLGRFALGTYSDGIK